MKRIDEAGPKVALVTLLAPISWGTTYITITEFLPNDRPLFVAACRVVPAGLLLLAIGLLLHRGPRQRRNWRQLSVLGLFNFGLFFPLLIAGIYRLPGGVAASVGGIQPLLVALIGWRLTKARPRRLDILVGVMAALGVAMVVVRPGASVDPVGVVAAIAANVSFSIGVVLTKKFDIGEDRLTNTGIQLLLSAIVIVPVTLLVEGGPPDLTGRNLVGVGYLSLVATGAAFVLWFNGIRRLPRQAPPVLGLAAPVTGAALGWIALNESLTWIQVAGFGITISAIVYAATLGSAEPGPPRQSDQPSESFWKFSTTSTQPCTMSSTMSRAGRTRSMLPMI